MTPITFDYLQEQGFKLLIPIVSQNEDPDEVITLWGKELDDKMIRLEYHSSNADSVAKNETAPFHPEGLKLYIGEKNEMELSYEGPVFYIEELQGRLNFNI